MTHRRIPFIFSIDAASIAADPLFRFDQRFLHLQKNLYQEKINLALTRIDVENITSGFYERSGFQNRLVTNLKEKYVEAAVESIRSGDRPALEVYWSQLVPGGGWVCPDDEIYLAAYRNLQIKFAPCRVLCPIASPSSEGAVWIKSINGTATWVRTIDPIITAYEAIEIKPELDLFNYVSRLIDICSKSFSHILDFHLQSPRQTNYHYVMHAVLRRHLDNLDTISKLIELERFEHAGMIMRLAYEAYLNFYLDWLSPEFFGPRLQLLSHIRRKGSQTSSPKDSALANFVALLEKTKEKARVSNMGTPFYNSIYATLSSIAHQDYAHVESESSGFGSKIADNLDANIEFFKRTLNVITASILNRICNDIGRDVYTMYRIGPS